MEGGDDSEDFDADYEAGQVDDQYGGGEVVANEKLNTEPTVAELLAVGSAKSSSRGSNTPAEDFGHQAPMFSDHEAAAYEEETPPETPKLPAPRPQSAESGFLAHMSSHLPKDHEAWVSKTMDNVGLAKSLMMKAKDQMAKNGEDVSYSASKKACQVQHHIKKKMGVTSDITKALEDRIESTEDTIRQVGECLFQLQRAQRAKWAPLNVCERRLELRESRPVQELVKDHLVEALEHERQTIVEARHELADQIESAKEMLTSLDAFKNDLVEELQAMRHALRVDRSAFIPAIKPDLAAGKSRTTDRNVLPKLFDVAHYARPQTPKNGESDEGKQAHARTLIQRVVQLQENGIRLCNACDAAMLNTKRECDKASEKTLASMNKRIAETSQLKSHLESQVAETDSAIVNLERSLYKTKQELHAHKELYKKQLLLLEQQSKLEGMHNMVGDPLLKQVQKAKAAVEGLTARADESKELLDSLRKARQGLVDDLKNKSQALKIEDSVLKTTARKAIELDRSDPRGGRCQIVKKRAPSSARGTFTPRALQLAGVSVTGDAGLWPAMGDAAYSSSPFGLGGYDLNRALPF